MFVQVIQGPVADAGRLREQFDTWVRDLLPGAAGWLGVTGGVADDGTFIAMVRFESESAARANSDRPEQGEWWARTASAFAGEPTFRDSTQVSVETPGDPSRAGFVQVMQGQVSDIKRALELLEEEDAEMREQRPDVLGRVMAGQEDGSWTMEIFFTSEDDARRGEQQQMPPAMEKRMGELQSISTGEPTFLDLRDPWIYAGS